MNKRDLRFFKAAHDASLMSDYKRIKIGAALVKGTHIVNSACNSNKTSPIQAKYAHHRYCPDCGSLPKVHSETAVLSPLIGRPEIDFSQYSIYVYREFKNGEKAMARPCRSCMALIKDLGIKRVFYTTPDGYVEENIIE